MSLASAVLTREPLTHPGGALKAFAVRFKQKRPDVSLYVTALPLKELIGRINSDMYRSDNPRGYQRQIATTRLKQIAAYMRDEEGMLPTSIVLCIRRPDRAQFEPAIGGNGGGETGLLRIADEVTLWVVDGQHRLFGLQRALLKDRQKWLADYPLPVVIVEGIDGYEEMRYFHVINTRHRGVPTDVVDRHLLSMKESEGTALLERQGERDYLRARATLLTDLLNTRAESPWKGMIRMPGELLRPEHTMRQHSVVASLAPVVGDAMVKRLTDEEAGKLLLNYWNAARERWQAAFDEPREHVCQKPLGAGALHQIFPDILEICCGEDDYSREKMFDILGWAGRSAGFWHSRRGHHMVRESGARHVRALAEYLRNRLPRPVLRRL